MRQTRGAAAMAVPSHAHRLWATLVGEEDSLAPGSTTVVAGDHRIAPEGWVGVIRLGDAVAVTTGRATPAAVDPLLALTDPTDLTAVRAVMAVDATLGPATLAYLPDGWRPEPARDDVGVMDAGPLRTWLDALPADDLDESGVGELDRVVVLRRGGQPVAVAGHHLWPTGIAHIGVVVAPDARGTGAGTAAGAAATGRAVAEGLHPQWRAREDNVASRRAARRIGYVEVGRQLSLRPEG